MLQSYKVAFLPAQNDGCGYYRIWLPYLRTPNSRFIHANEEGLVYYDSFADCHIGVVQRLASDKNLETVETMRKIGMKLVFDLDDDMWSVQSSNPAKELLKRFENYERGFMACATTCNVITVSTSRLKRVVESQIGTRVPVKTVPNAVDLSVLRPSPLPRTTGEIVIGWAGSNTHMRDLAEMGCCLDNLVDIHKKLVLHWIGMPPPGRFLSFHERVLTHLWVPVKEFHARLSTWDWDIGVAPLEDNRFNRSKSAIKMMEMGALKKPCLASPVQPYLEFTSLHPDLKWLLCESEKDWAVKLDELIRDAEKRRYYGNIMYEVVRANYNMSIRARMWKDAFQLAGSSLQ